MLQNKRDGTSNGYNLLFRYLLYFIEILVYISFILIYTYGARIWSYIQPYMNNQLDWIIIMKEIFLLRDHMILLLLNLSRVICKTTSMIRLNVRFKFYPFIFFYQTLILQQILKIPKLPPRNPKIASVIHQILG